MPKENAENENWLEKGWHYRFNPIRWIYEGLLCAKKNGETRKTFSFKKLVALIVIYFAIHSKYTLIFDPANHWSVILTNKKVAQSVIISLIASLDVLALGALSVYGWAKVKGAA